jgi:hypothetical protein
LWVVSIYFYADVTRHYLFHYTRFIIPDGCIVLIQFCFHVLVFVYLFCLFSNAKFYISLTVQLGIILVNNKLDALFSIYLFISLLYMFRATQCSSSGGSNCINTSSGIYHSV